MPTPTYIEKRNYAPILLFHNKHFDYPRMEYPEVRWLKVSSYYLYNRLLLSI
jgi:hypothetical protein